MVAREEQKGGKKYQASKETKPNGTRTRLDQTKHGSQKKPREREKKHEPIGGQCGIKPVNRSHRRPQAKTLSPCQIRT